MAVPKIEGIIIWIGFNYFSSMKQFLNLFNNLVSDFSIRINRVSKLRESRFKTLIVNNLESTMLERRLSEIGRLLAEEIHPS